MCTMCHTAVPGGTFVAVMTERLACPVRVAATGAGEQAGAVDVATCGKMRRDATICDPSTDLVYVMIYPHHIAAAAAAAVGTAATD